MSTFSAARAVLLREFLRLGRKRGQLVQPLLFFLLVAVLFPFAVGTDATLINRLGPAVVWVAVLLATTLSLDEIFRSDFDDGSLEQLVLSVYPLPLLVAMKSLAHWLTSIAPLILLALATTLLFDIDQTQRGNLATSLLLGTPVFSLVGAVGSALTVGLRGSAMLLALIMLPLYIPILIFGAAAVANAGLGLPTSAEHYFLAGLALMSLTLAPFATAAALRARLG